LAPVPEEKVKKDWCRVIIESKEGGLSIMEMVRRSQIVQVERYAVDFEWNDMPGAGFSFPCDKQGNILQDEMRPEGCQNLEKCLSGEYAVIPQGVRDYSYTYREPAQGRCFCGKIVELVDFTNTCGCGLEYNTSGQILAPRNQWEEPWDED
jgi:hypothetical protein